MTFHKQHRWIAVATTCALIAIAAIIVYWPREAELPTPAPVAHQQLPRSNRPTSDFHNATLLTAAQPPIGAQLDFTPSTQPPATASSSFAAPNNFDGSNSFAESPPISFMPERLSLGEEGQWQNGWDEPVTVSDDGLLAKLPDWTTATEWLSPAQPVANRAEAPTTPEAALPENFNHPSAPTTAADSEPTYTVRAGDTLWTISQKVYGTGALFVALAEHNRSRLASPHSLEVGQSITTPAAEKLVRYFPHLCPKPTVYAANSRMPTAHAARQVEYTVGLHDTLEKIAVIRLGRADRWREILALNHDVVGASGNYLKPGISLALPEDARSAATVLRPTNSLR
jgi:LysM repeat protein